MPTPKVYNLSWWYPPPAGPPPRHAPIARHVTSTVSIPKQIPAVILYPALATPEILVGDTAGDKQRLEILLLTLDSYPLPDLGMFVRKQLKISKGLKADKLGAVRGLFVDQTGHPVGTKDDRKIYIRNLPFEAGTKIATQSGRFSGYVHESAYKIFTDAGYKNLYGIIMSSLCLEAAMEDRTVRSWEPQDTLINSLLDKRNPWAEKNSDGQYCCFKDGGDDVDFTQFNHANPIQSYHPVYHYVQNDLNYANLAHISDVHLAARQQVLAKTKTRVIDYQGIGGETDFDNSPEIGTRVNLCSKDMNQILAKFATPDVDILLVGGDLVDFLRSCYLSSTINDKVQDGKPKDVWDAVALGKNYTTNYKDCPDMIAFFGILLKFCRANPKPAYAVSGNHDCYLEPYGLSPRLFAGLKRANEGIPSDHNLTFYEAILAFGETYAELKSGFATPFEAERFDWFYAVFTPFADYSVELPNQYLVAFQWGKDEKVVDAKDCGHGHGHLPRSTDAVSNNQLALLKEAIAKQKKVILLTHFTFVSYHDSIPNQGGDLDAQRGDVYFSPLDKYSYHDFGTFQVNRPALYWEHCLTNRDIQIILTGHSHRRALYLVDDLVVKEEDDNVIASVKTRHYDFDSLGDAMTNHPDILKPAIVVSDSGGTIPRYNLSGEFNGRGSDPPSGTTVSFDQGTGDLAAIQAQRADGCQPRIAVALDYLDIQEKTDVIVSFKSGEFLIEDEQSGILGAMTFTIELNPDLVQRGFSVVSLAFFLKWSPDTDWFKINLNNNGGNAFSITSRFDLASFSNFFAVNRSRGNFLAMKFAHVASMPRYNFGDPWCWEFQVDFETFYSGPFDLSPTYKSYQILRDKSRAEIPDFDWRRDNIPEKYL